jgi:protein gp37
VLNKSQSDLILQRVNMTLYNPWRGCHKISEGCQNCYIHSADKRRGIDTNHIKKTDQFDRLIRLNKKGDYVIKPNQLVYLAFSSDFLIEEADEWRKEVFKMIKKRSDLRFLFLTKRIHRFKEVCPDDWEENYSHVMVGCSVENQSEADKRLPYLISLPIKHRFIICQPLIGPINLEAYLSHSIDQVVVGGEAGKFARDLNYDWVDSIRNQCIKHKVDFEFRQLGSYFIKDNVRYSIPRNQLSSQARKANINVSFKE